MHVYVDCMLQATQRMAEATAQSVGKSLQDLRQHIDAEAHAQEY